VYLIWSNEHAMWWGPDERGYTGVIEAAGRYTREAAERICRDASVGGQLTVTRTSTFGVRLDVPPEVAVPAPLPLRADGGYDTERLAGVLAYYADEPDDQRVLTGRSHYTAADGELDWTGLTLGDLRAVLARLESAAAATP